MKQETFKQLKNNFIMNYKMCFDTEESELLVGTMC